jgi:hypothetical protein
MDHLVGPHEQCWRAAQIDSKFVVRGSFNRSFAWLRALSVSHPRSKPYLGFCAELGVECEQTQHQASLSRTPVGNFLCGGLGRRKRTSQQHINTKLRRCDQVSVHGHGINPSTGPRRSAGLRPGADPRWPAGTIPFHARSKTSPSPRAASARCCSSQICWLLCRHRDTALARVVPNAGWSTRSHLTRLDLNKGHSRGDFGQISDAVNPVTRPDDDALKPVAREMVRGGHVP